MLPKIASHNFHGSSVSTGSFTDASTVLGKTVLGSSAETGLWDLVEGRSSDPPRCVLRSQFSWGALEVVMRDCR